MAKIVRIFDYKGRFSAEIDDGRYYLSNGSMHILLCSKTNDGRFKVESNLVAGIMIKNSDDFEFCVSSIIKE